MVIKVLGSGCANCRKLEGIVREAVDELRLEAEVVDVTDLGDIMGYGVMSTPALVIDEQVRLAGRVPTLEQVVQILRTASQAR